MEKKIKNQENINQENRIIERLSIHICRLKQDFTLNWNIQYRGITWGSYGKSDDFNYILHDAVSSFRFTSIISSVYGIPEPYYLLFIYFFANGWSVESSRYI